MLGYRAKIFINHIPLATKTASLQEQSTVSVINYNVLQNSAMLKLPSFTDKMVMVNGYWTDYTAETHEYLTQENLQTLVTEVTTMLESIPPVGTCLINSFPTNFTVNNPFDGLINLSATWSKADVVICGWFSANEETVDSTGVINTYLDFLSSHSNGGKAVVIISDITGTATDAEILIQSDDNTSFSSPTTEATIEFSAVGVYVVDLNSTTDRYIRANLNSLGGATDITVTVLISVNGVTQ